MPSGQLLTAPDRLGGPLLVTPQAPWAAGSELSFQGTVYQSVDPTDATTYPTGTANTNTGPFFPTPDSLLVAVVVGAKTTDANYDLQSFSGGGLLWNRVKVDVYVNTQFYRMHWLIAESGTSPPLVTPQAVWTNGILGTNIWIGELTGYNRAQPVRQTIFRENASGVDPSATLLQVPLSTSLVIATALTRRNPPNFTPTTGWDEEMDDGISTPVSGLNVWRTKLFTPPQQSFSSSGTDAQNLTSMIEFLDAREVADQAQYIPPIPSINISSLIRGARNGPPLLMRQFYDIEQIAGVPTTYFVTIDASIAPTAVLTNQTQKIIAGSTTPAGTLQRQTSKTFAGSSTAVGVLSRSVAKSLAGSITGAGVLSRQTSKTFVGSTTAAGVLTRSTFKSFAGSSTPAGTLGPRTIGKIVVGSITATGTLIRRTSKTFAGSITATGSFSSLKVILKTLAGSIAPSGALSRSTAKTFAGSSTPAGALTRRTSKNSLVGSITPAGALTKLKVSLLVMSGTITAAGTLIRQTAKTFAGSITGAGTLSRKTSKTMTGSITPAGAMTKLKLTILTFAGSITPAGILSRRTSKSFSGSSAPAGVLSRRTSKTFSGSSTPTGVLTRLLSKLFVGSVTPAGILTRRQGKSFAGQISAVGGLTKRTVKVPFLAGITPQGVMAKRLGKLFAGSITATGALTSRVLGFGVRQYVEVIFKARIYEAVSKLHSGEHVDQTLDAVDKVIDVDVDRTYGGFSG